MKMVKRFLSAGLCAAMMLSAGSAYASDAADAITIDSVVFSAVEGDDTLVKATVGFTAVYPAEEVTILMATEEAITTDNTDDVMYINQVARPEDGKLEFVIEKSRILASTEAEDVNGTKLFVKMGGTDINTMATGEGEIAFAPAEPDYIQGDPDGDGIVTSMDAIYALCYEAAWDLGDIDVRTMEVDGDGIVTSMDAIYMLCFEAGWDVEFVK